MIYLKYFYNNIELEISRRSVNQYSWNYLYDYYLFSGIEECIKLKYQRQTDRKFFQRCPRVGSLEHGRAIKK